MFVAASGWKALVSGLTILTFSGSTLAVGICTELEDDCGGDPSEHWAPLISTGSLTNPHQECKDGDEFPSHWPNCQLGDMDQQAFYDEAEIAAAHGDVEALMALGPDLKGHLTYNRDRAAIQLGSCANPNSIVASIPVPDGLIDAALQKLVAEE